jgi:hypothetical protein
MLRVSRGVAGGIVAGAALLVCNGHAAAQTTTTTHPTTTITPTTTTTLLPHPFSAATRSCIHRARAGFRACRRGADVAACAPAFQAAFSGCFAPGVSGVTCTKKCVTNETTCLGKAPTTHKTCDRACLTTRRADVLACHRIADGDNIWAGGDAACLTTAAANFDLCKFVCAEAALDCRTALRFCVANCTNL